MPTAQKAELSLVRNVDTAGKADTLLRKLYVAVAVPIAERLLNIASSIMPTAQKAELSLVRNVDTAGKADTLLRKLYVAVAVPIAERDLKYLIPEREFSEAAHIMKSLRPEKAIKCCATLW